MRDREIQLDLIRGVAILLAMGWHLNGPSTNPIAMAMMMPGSRVGWAGVDLFFVLSGFLVGRLILEEGKASGSFDYRRFLIRRAFRLWPVLYVYLAFQPVFGRFPWQSYLPQTLLHIQNYFNSPISHLWSLAVEEHFYLLAGLALPALLKRGSGPRRFLTVLVVILAASLPLRVAAVLSGVSATDIQHQTHYRMDALACGVLLAALYVYRPETFQKLKSRPLLLWLGALGGFAVVGLLRDIPDWRVTAGFTLAYLSSAALLLAVHGRTIPKVAMPIARALAFLGLYSYSLYVWHIGTGRLAAARFTGLFPGAPPELVIIVKYAAAIALAFGVTRLIERPAIALRNRLFPVDTA